MFFFSFAVKVAQMVLILVVGDLHIPHRAASIPDQYLKMFTRNRIDAVFVTGNVCNKETLEIFKAITSNVHVAKGEFDDYDPDIPEVVVTQIEDIKFGIIHGHQVVPWGDKDSLAIMQRKLDVDVLVSGNTHQSKTFEFDGHLFVNPGSITGAFSAFEPEVAPSFILMEVKGSAVQMWTYHLAGDKMPVKKKQWTKR